MKQRPMTGFSRFIFSPGAIMSIKHRALLASALALLPFPAAVATAEPAPAPAAAQPVTDPMGPAHYGAWGIDLTARDTSVKPGDDFDRYANGRWKDTHPFPADRSEVGMTMEIFDRGQARLRELVTSAPP